jgi:beta-galactosidase/beta-glucuronidase
LVVGGATTATAKSALLPARWYALTATYDGSVARLYVDGEERASVTGTTLRVAPELELAPAPTRDFDDDVPHFGGSLAGFTVFGTVLTPQAIRERANAPPDFSATAFEAVGVGWPLQEHAWRGLQVPQDAWTLPHARVAPDGPAANLGAAATVAAASTASVVAAAASAQPSSMADWPELNPRSGLTWEIQSWHLAAAPNVSEEGDVLSQADYADMRWLAAVVPGTVLTTLIARGIYPEPDYGLNNLAIPESLNRQDYWYRSVFRTPDAVGGRHLTLTFNGINYAAQVWLNGRRLGDIHGAFTRGIFDVTGMMAAGGRNAIAVRVSPPPHPGIPHEQSIAAGPGNNGGAMALDGPTFIATEGWDWIPAIRDRDTGLWQSVELAESDDLKIGDPRVVTHLPLPRTDSADIAITVPIENRSSLGVDGTVSVHFAAVTVRKKVNLAPGRSEVQFDAAEFAALHLQSPRLWWPNGYGEPYLYTLTIGVSEGSIESDSVTLRFGIRELTYDLSLFDGAGHLRRVEVDPTVASLSHERVIDVRHQAIKRTPQGWAESLTRQGESSAAVHPAATESLSPYLVIRVNGVPIAARGGNWGMDDSRKRISREHLEPFFRLHREAHLNIIRNWLGQNTEPIFYDLADEYGMLVLNDFWVSTQDFQLEPQDPQLFLANARDVISRYRNHPSIAVWLGRNEGVPQPIINEGLADLVATIDGTRYYTGSSNAINLQGSGPYNYRPPEQYFTELARGFSVEVGTPSLSTVEAIRASIPAADQWPLSDTYAYHDWHFGGNGDTATFMAALADQHGAAENMEDFERKAQLMDYVSYRAIFEGFAAHLWTQNSGRLLWMTQPAWPSNTWQIYSADYDTAAAYYAVKKACEPVHAQLDLPGFRLVVVNTTREAMLGLKLRSRVYSLDNRLLAERVDRVDARANAAVPLAGSLDLAALVARHEIVLVKLVLADGAGTIVSENVYWEGKVPSSELRLDALAPQPVTVVAHVDRAGDESRIAIEVTNRGTKPVLNAKLTMLDERGARALPVYYSDNYITLLAGERRVLHVDCTASAQRCARLAIRGWNVIPAESSVAIDGP